MVRMCPVLALPACPGHLPYLRSRFCLTDAMDEMREEASYCVSRWSVMVHRELITLAILPLASAKARRVSSTSGVEQQLKTENKKLYFLKNMRKSR